MLTRQTPGRGWARLEGGCIVSGISRHRCRETGKGRLGVGNVSSLIYSRRSCSGRRGARTGSSGRSRSASSMAARKREGGASAAPPRRGDGKAWGGRLAPLASHGPPAAGEEEEARAGAGDADEEEPPLLRHLGL